MNIPEDLEFIPGVKLLDEATPGLPPELELEGHYYGGDPDGLWLVETVLGERLTAEQWNARFRQWRDGIPPAPIPRPGSPESYLSPEQRDGLEKVVLEASFKAKNHLRYAAAAVLSRTAPSKIAACTSAVATLGPVNWGKDDPAVGVPRSFYRAVIAAVRAFDAPD
jgi:hypothetical protein